MCPILRFDSKAHIIFLYNLLNVDPSSMMYRFLKTQLERKQKRLDKYRRTGTDYEFYTNKIDAVYHYIIAK